MHSNYSPPFSPQAEQLSSDLERASISFEGSCDCLGRPLTNNAAAAASVKGGRRQLSSIVCPRFRLCGLAAARLHETWTPSLALISGWTLPRVRYSCAFQLFLTRASFSVHLSAAAGGSFVAPLQCLHSGWSAQTQLPAGWPHYFLPNF